MFEKMLTPVLVTILFWVGSAGIVIGAFMAIDNRPIYAGGEYTGYVLLGAFAAVIFFRIMCEWLIVQFRIYEVLVEIRDRQNPVLPDGGDERKEPKIREWSRQQAEKESDGPHMSAEPRK